MNSLMTREEREQEEKREWLDRLGEIKLEMEELLDEAKFLTRELDRGEWDRAERTWYAHIQMHLDGDHEWLGGASHTLEDTLATLEVHLDESEAD